MAYLLSIFVISFVMVNASVKTTWLWRAGEGPKDLPYWAYRHLVMVLNIDPDFSAALKCVEQRGFIEHTLVSMIRVFAPDMDQAFEKIKVFASLDQYPELILFEGYQENVTGKIVMFKGPASVGL